MRKGPVVNVTCSRCSGEYIANKQYYNKSKRAGNPNLCLECRRQVLQANGVLSAKKKAQNNVSRCREFLAPCMMKIVPKNPGVRSRCKPALAGRCPQDMHEQCLDFTARQDWSGWKVAE